MNEFYQSVANVFVVSFTAYQYAMSFTDEKNKTKRRKNDNFIGIINWIAHHTYSDHYQLTIIYHFG